MLALQRLLLTGSACGLNGFTAQIGDPGCGRTGRQFRLPGFDPGQGGGNRITTASLLGHLLTPCLTGLLMAIFPTQALRFESLLFGLKALLGALCLLRFLLQSTQFGFFFPIVLHQRDAAGADPGAGAAFDAVIDMILLRLVVLSGFAVPIELLWQQTDRAGIGTLTAADAIHLLARRRQLHLAGSHQAVTDLDDRHIGMGQGKAHHGATHDNALPGLGIELELA